MQYPTIILDGPEIKLAEEKAAERVAFFRPRILGKKQSGSNIQNFDERLKRLGEDQITGQLAQLGGTIYLTGGN